MKKYLTKTPIVILLAILCMTLWGSAFPCIKIGYNLFHVDGSDTASQILFAGVRFTLAGVMVIAVGSIANKKLLLPKKRITVRNVFMLSALQTVIQYTFFYIGLANTTGSKAAIVEALNVFMLVLISSLMFHMEKLTAKKLIGCIIGFAGVVLANIVPGGMGSGFKLTGEGFIVISTISYAFSSVLMKYLTTDADDTMPIMLSGYQFLVGGVILSIIGVAMGGHFAITSAAGAGILLYLVFVSAAAYSIWSLLLKYNPVSKISVFGFVNPMVGVLLSALILSETDSLGINSVFALILVCIGIVIVNYQKHAAGKAV